MPRNYEALLYEARDHPRGLAILQVFLQTGIREGELCALTLQDPDLLAKELHVGARRGGVDTAIPGRWRGRLVVRPGWHMSRVHASSVRTRHSGRAGW